jgi:hypothetical protein
LLTCKQAIITFYIQNFTKSKKATHMNNVVMRKIFAILAGLIAGKARISPISPQTASLESYGNPNGGHN